MKLIITSRVKKAVKCECHVIPSNLYVLLPLSIFVDVTTSYCFMFYHLSSKKSSKRFVEHIMIVYDDKLNIQIVTL